MSSSSTATTSPTQLPNTEDLIDKLRNSGFEKLVEELSTVVREPYESQIKQLEQQSNLEGSPEALKKHLQAAIDSVRQAQQEANQPVLDRLAEAILTMTREHHVPLGFVREANVPVASASSESPEPRRRKRLDRARVCEQIKMLARQTGESGFTTTAVARRLQISKPQAMAICKEMHERGDLSHNGQPRRFSRYLDPKAAA